jgi:glycosyltransferase involved in cell wall biosynthesis
VLRVVGGLDPTAGGPPESTVAACLATEARGARNTLVFPTAEAGTSAAGDLLGRLEAAGIEVHGFPVVPRNGTLARRWGVSPALVRWIWSNADHDVIHVHGAMGFATTAALLTGLLRGIPVVVSPHESLTDYDREHSRGRVRRLLKRLLRMLYTRGASLIVFASGIEAEDSGGSTLPPGRDLVAPHPVANGIAVGAASAAGEPMRVGFLGRFHRKKNLDLLIQAVAALPDDVRLAVAGDGPPGERRRLESLAEAAAVSHRVEWRGWLDADARDGFLAGLDVLAMPSEYECFGMAGAEALVRGVPVVTSPRTGIAEIIERHDCGVVTATDAPALAAAIAELAAEPARCKQMRDRAIEAAQRDLSYEAFGDALMSRYRQLGT